MYIKVVYDSYALHNHVSAGQTLCLVVVAVYAAWFFNHPTDTTYGWVPLTFLVAGALLTHMGIRLLPWILIGEVNCFTTLPLYCSVMW